jgi:L-lactate dehydrogenase complex protein LldG
MSRDHILHKVRTALGRNAGQAIESAPAVRLTVPTQETDARIASLCARVEALAGKTYHAASAADAGRYVAAAIEGKTAVASNAPLLAACGITALPNVRSGFYESAILREACASAGCGITSADYALADTGTLVMLASPQEARLISLLPPVHIAVVASARVLTSLDELLSLLPRPAEQTSSMVLITGPSRTADIEQILVRGVHGPGEIHVVVV